jgi:hypothetical protein
MMPRLAALSIAEMIRRILFASGFSEERVPFCIERRRVTTLRLRSDRSKVWRARLAADLVLAMFSNKLVGVDGGGRDRDCQDRAAPPQASESELGLGRVLGDDRTLFWSGRRFRRRTRRGYPIIVRSAGGVNEGGVLARLRLGRFCHAGQTLRDDLDESADGKLIVKRSDIGGFHSDATIASRMTDRSLFRGSVNVDAAVKSMRILRFKTAQPDNTRNHGVSTRGIGSENFAGKTAVVKDGTHRRVVPNFLCDSHVAKWSGHSSPKIAEPILGSRNWINRHFGAVLQKHQLLVAHADHNPIGIFHLESGGGRAGEEKESEKRDKGAKHARLDTHYFPLVTQ